MTAQVGEQLFYRGQEVSMCTEPLVDYSGHKKISFETRDLIVWKYATRSVAPMSSFIAIQPLQVGLP